MSRWKELLISKPARRMSSHKKKVTNFFENYLIPRNKKSVGVERGKETYYDLSVAKSFHLQCALWHACPDRVLDVDVVIADEAE